MRSITYVNPLNVAITFGPDTPFVITSLEGLDLTTLNIQSQKSPYQDGSTNIDQLLDDRDIVMDFDILAFQDLSKIATYKRQIISICNPKLGPGTITYTNDNKSYTAYHVLPEGPMFKNKEYTSPWQVGEITFHCHDPFWYDTTEQNISLQTVVNNLTFPVVFTAGGIVFSSYVGGAKTLYNEGDYKTPVTVDIYGPCINPALTKTSTGEYIKINKTMASGDKVEINTAMGNKTVYYTASGGSPVNAINLLDLGSTFFQLDVGYNAVQLTDDASSAAKQCFVQWYNRYVGV